MYRWVVLLHILAVFTFILAHGASAKVAFKVRRETNPERLATLLNLSAAYSTVMYVALLVIFLAGIAISVWGNWRGQVWPWLVLGLTLAVVVAMGFIAGNPFRALREMMGLPNPGDRSDKPATPVGAEEILASAAAFRPALVAAAGLGGLTLILGLVVLRPF